MSAQAKRILSGIQPSGTLHLGNYFGMMKPAIQWQEKGEAFYFIADYHSLTTLHEAAKLRENVRGAAIDFLACGLDPQKACFFRQSDLPEVTELMWILTSVTPMGLIERCTSYKDKVAHGIPTNVGLFAYPVLMAADILLYDSDIVPVGKDQKQHVEVTRDIAIKMNETFGKIFKLPEPSIEASTATVPGLDGKKMSKSYGNSIDIFLPEKPLRKLVMGLKTDSTPVEDPKNPDESLIVELYKLVAGEDAVAEMRKSFLAGGTGYGTYKQQLFEAIWTYFAPMRERREQVLADPGYVDKVLAEGAQRARAVAAPVLQRVRKAVGLA